MGPILKDPAAVLDYGLDWSEWLPDGDTIAASTWTVPTGLTVDSDTFNDVHTTVWLSGGTAGQVYQVVNQITTAEGRTDERTLVIQCADR